MKKLLLALLFFSFPYLIFAQSKSTGSDIPAVNNNDCFVKKDKLYIPPQYLNILKFQENLAPVKIIDSLGFSAQGKIGFVNTSGQLTIPAQYDTLFSHFRKGVALVGIYLGDGIFGKGIIDKKNNILVPFQFEDVGETRNEFVLVKAHSGQWGFYNTATRQLSNTAYETIRFFKKEYFLVTSLGKRGVIDQSGRVVIPLEYKEILARKDGSLELRGFSRYMIKNFKNEIINQLECDSVIPQQPGLYKYAINGKYGIIKGQNISSPVYDLITAFAFNKAIVQKGNLHGVIDTSGALVLPLIYDHIKTDTLGLLYVKGTKSKQFGSYFIQEKRRSWAVMDKNLQTVLTFLYKDILPMGDSMFAVLNEQEKWGYINYRGKLAVPFKYDFAKPFKKGFAEVGIREPYKKIYSFINKSGAEAVAPENHHVYAAGIGIPDSTGEKIAFNYPYNSFHKFSYLNGIFVKVKYGYKYGVASPSSDLIVSTDYDSVVYSPGQNCIIVYKEGQAGIFGALGDTVHPLTDKYQRIYPFKEGYARVWKDGKFGCIDYNKNRRISMQYAELMDVNESLIGVMINGKWGFFDRNEAIKVQPYYAEVKPFKNGVARARTGQYWDFVNTEGKIISSTLYQGIEETKTGKWIVTYNGKKGMADENGREMLVPRYQHVTDLGQGFLQVWREGKTGVLNYDQNFILPIEHSNLAYDAVNDNFIIHEPGSLEKRELGNNSKQK